VLQLFIGQIVLHRLTLNKPGWLTRPFPPSQISHKKELLSMIPKNKLLSTKLCLLGLEFRRNHFRKYSQTVLHLGKSVMGMYVYMHT